MLRRTKYPKYLHLALNEYIHILDSSLALSWKLPFHHTLHNNTPEFCVPTKAVWKYTSHGFLPASADMSFQNSPEQISIFLISMPQSPALPSRPSLQTIVALPLVLLLYDNDHEYLHYGNAEQPLPEAPSPLSPQPLPFLPHNDPYQSIFPEH